MADIVDIAQEHMDAAAPGMIAASKKPEGPKHTGICANCGEKLAADLRFCDADCREDWEFEQQAKARNGKGVDE